jgi:hypothetical protein
MRTIVKQVASEWIEPWSPRLVLTTQYKIARDCFLLGTKNPYDIPRVTLFKEHHPKSKVEWASMPTLHGFYSILSILEQRCYDQTYRADNVIMRVINRPGIMLDVVRFYRIDRAWVENKAKPVLHIEVTYLKKSRC